MPQIPCTLLKYFITGWLFNSRPPALVDDDPACKSARNQGAGKPTNGA